MQQAGVERDRGAGEDLGGPGPTLAEGPLTELPASGARPRVPEGSCPLIVIHERETIPRTSFDQSNAPVTAHRIKALLLGTALP